MRNETGPRQSNVHSEAVEGLLDESVLAKSGLPTESTAAVGTSEEARWQRQRVADGERRVMGCKRKEFLPEAFLDLPEISSLPSEGGAMDEAQCGKPLAVVPSEVAVECLVGVQTEELSDDLDGEDLRVGEFRGGAALAQGSSVFEPLVYVRQKTATMKVLRSIRRRPPLRSVPLSQHRA